MLGENITFLQSLWIPMSLAGNQFYGPKVVERFFGCEKECAVYLSSVVVQVVPPMLKIICSPIFTPLLYPLASDVRSGFGERPTTATTRLEFRISSSMLTSSLTKIYSSQEHCRKPPRKGQLWGADLPTFFSIRRVRSLKRWYVVGKTHIHSQVGQR